jgi:hypothetical protein
LKLVRIVGAAIALGLSTTTFSPAQQRGPVETFAAIAKAAAANYAEYPAFATYHFHQLFHRGKGDDRLLDWSVKERLSDRLDVLYDERAKKETVRASPVSTLIFDALSTPILRGRFAYTLFGIEFLFQRTESRAYRYDPTNADAVVRSVRGFTVTFADDATPEIGHLAFTPIANDTRNAGAHLTDVYYTRSTLLPTRIVFAGPSNTVLDHSFQIAGGKWLLHTSYARHTFEHVGLFAQVTIENTKTFEDVKLSDVAPDPRLAYPAEVPVAVDRLREYAGTYRMATSWKSPTTGARIEGPLVNWTIRVAGDRLELTDDNDVKFPLYAKSDSRFFLKRASGEIGFFREGATNKIARLVFYQDGFEREGTPVP